MLSPVLAVDKSFEDIITHDGDWYRENGVTCRFGAYLVVMAAGIRPATKLAVDSGVYVDVDDVMQTSEPDILAVGECVEDDETVYGLVAPLYEMAKVLACTLVNTAAKFVAPMVSTKLKVTGVDLFSAGDFSNNEALQEIVFRDPACGVYKRLVLDENKIAGVVMYGDTTDTNWLFEKLKTGEDITEIRDRLIYGPVFQGGADHGPLAAA